MIWISFIIGVVFNDFFTLVDFMKNFNELKQAVVSLYVFKSLIYKFLIILEISIGIHDPRLHKKHLRRIAQNVWLVFGLFKGT